MNIRRYIANNISSMLPPTRMYRLKALLYKWCGYSIHRTARIVSSARIWGAGVVSIGEDTFVGHDVLILTGDAPITIGNFVDIAPRVAIVNGSHEIDMDGRHSAGEGCSKPIVIEDGVWIGAGTIILGGVSIGAKSVIAAGSVCTSNIPAGVMAAGVPCKPIKRWDRLSTQWIRLS